MCSLYRFPEPARLPPSDQRPCNRQSYQDDRVHLRLLCEADLRSWAESKRPQHSEFPNKSLRLVRLVQVYGPRHIHDRNFRFRAHNLCRSFLPVVRLAKLGFGRGQLIPDQSGRPNRDGTTGRWVLGSVVLGRPGCLTLGCRPGDSRCNFLAVKLSRF